jgi:predicted ester cyclase
VTPEEERNLEAAKKWTLLYNTDPERCCDETLADDVETHVLSRKVHSAGSRESYRAAVRANLAALPDRKQRVIALAASGDKVFVEMFWEGTSSGAQERFGPKGTAVSVQCISVLRFVDGRIASETVYS